MAEVKSAGCAIIAIVILQSLSLPVVEAAVNSSLPVGDAKGTVSAPRNLSRSVIGVVGDNRKFRVLWTASKDNGGLPVNYTVKLCLKDYSDCRNSASPDCHVTNVVSPSKEFRCVLSESDFWFLGPLGEFSEHNLCVEASNVAGKNKTCIHADIVGGYVATPRPPLNFRVGLENGQFTVRWGERTSWKLSPVIKRLYTVTYYPSSKKLKTKVVTDRTIAILTDLEPYTEYCVLLFIQFKNEDGDKTAPSDRLGPLCSKTPAGEPSNRPQVVAYKNYLFPENPRVRDVAVEWKLALPSSWNGTPGQFVICCDCPSVGKQNAQAKKCEYHANATANSTVLRGLNSGNDYLVSMEKCNEEGKCSGRGRPYRIEAVRGDERKPPKVEKISKAQIAGISLSIIPGVAFAVGAVYMIRKWRRERRPLDEFHYGEVEPDVQHEYCEINERKNEYDRVAGENERVDIV